MTIYDPIFILGGGHMGSALATRWHRAKSGKMIIIEPDEARRTILSTYGIRCYAHLADTTEKPSLLVLAIKPQQFPELLAELKPFNTTPILSIMAGISLAALRQISPHAVRVMPNLPAQIGEGMSVACAPGIDKIIRDRAQELFTVIGKLIWVEDESMLHAATAISGSGPGYVFAFMEAMEQAAIAQGFDAETARQLVRQTLRGATLLSEQSTENATRLRQQVTSPGGTTEAALTVLSSGKFDTLINDAITAAALRSKELAK